MIKEYCIDRDMVNFEGEYSKIEQIYNANNQVGAIVVFSNGDNGINIVVEDNVIRNYLQLVVYVGSDNKVIDLKNNYKDIDLSDYISMLKKVNSKIGIGIDEEYTIGITREQIGL